MEILGNEAYIVDWGVFFAQASEIVYVVVGECGLWAFESLGPKGIGSDLLKVTEKLNASTNR